MCSRLNVVSVQVQENPAKPTDPFKLEITFEVFEHIKEDVEWELVFVATDGREEHDQVLDSVLIGPINDGRHKFVFEAPAPELKDLRPEDLMDVTLLLLKCKYKEQLFMKIGWFITHTYSDRELSENPPPLPVIDKLQRTIVTGDVRVTTYPIKWEADGGHQQQPDEEQEDESDDITMPMVSASGSEGQVAGGSNSTPPNQQKQSTPMVVT